MELISDAITACQQHCGPVSEKATNIPVCTQIENDGYMKSNTPAGKAQMENLRYLKSATCNPHFSLSCWSAVLDVRFKEIVLALVNLSSVFHGTQLGNHCP
jgi:hypothetical protein